MDVNALKQHCRQISEEILEFLADRETSAPKVTPTPKPWQATNFEKLRHDAETLALAQERFSSKGLWSSLRPYAKKAIVMPSSRHF